MDISTINVIVGSLCAAIGGAILFTLGIILQYFRGLNKWMREIYEKNAEHETKIASHEKWLTGLDDKVYKLNRT